jgi:hypothetical protein
MIRGERTIALLLPWAGLIGAVLGGALTHQIGSDGTFDHCGSAGAPLVLVVVLLGVLLSVGGGITSLRIWRRRRDEPAARGFIALVSMMASGLFLFAILLPLFAALLIPRCYG